jgi:hypothetical protein
MILNERPVGELSFESRASAHQILEIFECTICPRSRPAPVQSSKGHLVMVNGMLYHGKKTFQIFSRRCPDGSVCGIGSSFNKYVRSDDRQGEQGALQAAAQE